MVKKSINLLLILSFSLWFKYICLAQPPAQEMGGQERARQMEEHEEALRKKIEEEKKAPQIQEEFPQAPAPAVSEQKVLIQDIRVTGASLIPAKEINEIIAPYKNKELTIADMQVYSFKGSIKICRDSAQLNYIYHRVFNNEPAKITRSFYAYEVNTVYTSPENFTLGIIGHEMAHAIISHYFVVLPSVKIQEVLSAYVEYQLRNTGQ